MSRLLWIALACSFAFSAVAVPTVAQTAKAKADKCTVHPSDIRRQCALELGGMCDPSTGIVTLEGHQAVRFWGSSASRNASRESADRRNADSADALSILCCPDGATRHDD